MCLAMRAVHIEVAHSLDAESFLNAFSRFTAWLKKLKSNEAQLKIHHSLQAKEVTWHFNPPLASHSGGIWKIMIRSIRRILAAVMDSRVVDDEAFHTFLIEVERTDDLDLLTPSKLLLLHSNACVPPGVSLNKDCYNKRWRQAQLLANIFWKRWLKEYIPMLQRCQKWLLPKKNLVVKDLVLLVDKDKPRGRWPLGVMEEVFPDEKGIVRHVMVRMANGNFRRDVVIVSGLDVC